jgi:hypothetical protein
MASHLHVCAGRVGELTPRCWATTSRSRASILFSVQTHQPGPAHGGGMCTVQIVLLHTVSQCVFVLHLAPFPPSVFSLAKLQVASACTTLTPPCPPLQSSGPSPTLDTWTHPPNPPVDRPVPHPSALVQQTPAPFPPHSVCPLPFYFYHHLPLPISTQPLRTLPYLGHFSIHTYTSKRTLPTTPSLTTSDSGQKASQI